MIEMRINPPWDSLLIGTVWRVNGTYSLIAVSCHLWEVWYYCGS